MTTKTYKTVSGYLRSADERMRGKIPWNASDDLRIAAIKTGQRNIINHMLDQIELPILDDRDPPLEGIERLLVVGGTKRQVKALKDCQRWLKNCRIVTNVSFAGIETQRGIKSYRSGAVTGGETAMTAPGFVSYHIHGFKRDDHSIRVSVIVDAAANALDDHIAAAEAIAGPDYCLHASENINRLVTVPDAVKNRLLTNEELFALVPELNPQRERRATRR